MAFYLRDEITEFKLMVPVPTVHITMKYPFLLFLLTTSIGFCQIPMAKTRAERKAERKTMTLEERIEDALPVDVSLPSASAKLPGSDNISSIEDAKKYFTETLPGYGADVKKKAKKKKEELKKLREKSFNGKEFENFKVEKQIYKRGSSSRMTYIEFYTLDQKAEPSPYHRILTWYDTKRKRITDAIARDRSTNLLLHGPYKEYRGENLVKEGFYYLGQKHGRWVSYDKDFILLDKETYHKGYLEESIISYYDTDSTKIKEIIPVLYGEKTGEYLLYHKEGTLATEGFLEDGVRIGKWVEYYPTGNRRKKEWQYGATAYDKVEPTLLREYDESGRLIYEHDTVKK